MSFSTFINSLVNTPSRSHPVLWLPDTETEPADEGYFAVRLSEMFLTHQKVFFKEVMPTAFMLAEYNYGTAQISQPFFASNKVLKGVAEQVGTSKLRVNFVDTLAIGPAPYTGGEVSLFVGLFQTAMADQRKEIFAIFETLLGGVGLGSFTNYLHVADKLTASIVNCLGATDVECLLAEKRSIGPQKLPPHGHLVYLHNAPSDVSADQFEVKDNKLYRKNGATLTRFEECDFCLVRIERMQQRNDYQNLPFHQMWTTARKKMLVQQTAEAQALMLECSYAILDSPDLTESNKVSLIQFYQAKLAALHVAAGSRGEDMSGGRRYSLIGTIVNNANASTDASAGKLPDLLESISVLSAELMQSATNDDDDDDDALLKELQKHVGSANRPYPSGQAAELVKSIALGCIKLDDSTQA